MIRCIYHDNCLDGLFAAAVVYRSNTCAQNRRPITFHPVSYGDPPPDIDDADVVYIVDFSYPPDVLAEWAEYVDATEGIYVYDHHQSAVEKFDGHPPIDGVELVLDVERSGAQIAWDELVGGKRHELIDIVADRDLWKFDDPQTEPVTTYLSSQYLNKNPKHINILISKQDENSTTYKFERFGDQMLEYRDHLVDQIAESAHEMTINGHTVLVVNGPGPLRSELGHRLAEMSPSGCGVVWRADGPNSIRMSFRSSEDADITALELAKIFGGGGHEHAAGAEFTISEAMDLLGIVEWY